MSATFLFSTFIAHILVVLKPSELRRDICLFFPQVALGVLPIRLGNSDTRVEVFARRKLRKMYIRRCKYERCRYQKVNQYRSIHSWAVEQA
jgi:hypothetical protein